MKIKALAFVLMAVLLLCGCGQKSETAATTPAQAVTASAAQSSTARPVSTGVTPEQIGAKGDGIADDLQALQAAMQQASASGRPLELTAGGGLPLLLLPRAAQRTDYPGKRRCPAQRYSVP